MSTFFWGFFTFWVRVCLSLRYSLKVEGLDRLHAQLDRGKGILFLPNHPAHMDPLLIFALLWSRFKMRPLVIEYIYRLAFLRPFMKLVRAISIPNFETSVNELKVKKAEQALQEIAEGLKKGDAFVLYPSGRLKSTGKEIVGGASAAHTLMEECPDINIVLIRTSGLWGSSFSRAILGYSPDLLKTLFHGIRVLLKNLLFFTPRRKLYIELEVNPVELPRKGNRVDFNRYLENWYNHYLDDEGKIYVEEPVKLVSYSFWRKKVFQPKGAKKKLEAEKNHLISAETRKKIYKEIQKILDNPKLEVKPEMNLTFDLGLDSLNIAELISYVSQNYDVGEIHPEDLETVQSLLECAEGAKKGRRERVVSTFTWPKEEKRPPPVAPFGRTIPEAFLRACQRMKGYAACGDDVVGVLSYDKMKTAVFVLAGHFRTLPDESIAVLLPASAGAFIVILALELAGKVPVMLNWTLGPRYLEGMMAITGAKKVISSWKFVDRLAHVDFGNLTNQIHYLEDIRKSLSLKTKLRGALLAKCPFFLAYRAFQLHNFDENKAAVILFTSGTESTPKAVPLSHKNIISNQRSSMQCLALNEKDVMFGILPPFHSFGFSVAGFFSLLSGMRVAFYPDPTDSFALAEGVERWKITIFCAAPSFLRGLLHVAEKKQLKTVRFFVSGAEKTPHDLFLKVEHLETRAKLIEGYGITECSPVLTINRPNLPPKGVGRPLPDVEICTIHPETEKLLPPHTEGEICIFGPNVFHGYLGNPRQPFIEIEGKKWYRTGDLGFLDKENNLILSGRLKRFTKVGGEMISLGAVEEELIKGLHVPTDSPSIAICSDEHSGDKSLLILFTTIDVDKEQANAILKAAGFSRLIKISQVQKIEEIPLMGTGKTDYRKLLSELEKKHGT